jgi:hypothetical protein
MHDENMPKQQKKKYYNYTDVVQFEPHDNILSSFDAKKPIYHK